MSLKIPPKFICDEMLKKLARWLRIIGFDVTDPQVKNDRQLAKISQEEGRIILTRDKDLSNMKEVFALRIYSDDLMEQLEQVLKEYPPKDSSSQITRCPSCNGELQAIRSDDVDRSLVDKRNIPKRILTSYDMIYLCTLCTKSYWTGSHWDQISDKLQKLGVDPLLPGLP